MRHPLRWLFAGTLAVSLLGCNAGLNGCLPITPGTPPGADRIGVGVGIDENNALAEAEIAFTYLEQAGITWARVPFSWADIQPTRESLDWQTPDAIIEAAARHNIRLHVVLKDTAPWASVSPFAGVNRAKYPPANMNDWFRFVLLTSTRYRDKIDTWEIWEGIDRFPQWSGRPEQYMQLLGLAHKAIKLTTPQARVVMGGLTMANDRNRQFLDLCLRDRVNAFDALVDAIGFAPGTVMPGELRERLYAIRRDLRLNQADKPIIVSGLSWSSDRGLQGPCDNYQGGEVGQARYVREIMPWLIGLGTERVYWQTLWDGPADSQSGAIGLVDRQLHAKAALGTIAGLADPSRIGQIAPVASDAAAAPASDTAAVPASSVISWS